MLGLQRSHLRPDRVVGRQCDQMRDRVQLQDHAKIGQLDGVVPGEADQLPSAARAPAHQPEPAERGEELLQAVRRHAELAGHFGDVERGARRHVEAQHPVEEDPFQVLGGQLVRLDGQPVLRPRQAQQRLLASLPPDKPFGLHPLQRRAHHRPADIKMPCQTEFCRQLVARREGPAVVQQGVIGFPKPFVRSCHARAPSFLQVSRKPLCIQ